MIDGVGMRGDAILAYHESEAWLLPFSNTLVTLCA